MMMRKLCVYLPAFLLILLAASAHAQGGCVNSPENPTLVLGLVGSAAAAVSVTMKKLRRK